MGRVAVHLQQPTPQLRQLLPVFPPIPGSAAHVPLDRPMAPGGRWLVPAQSWRRQAASRSPQALFIRVFRICSTERAGPAHLVQLAVSIDVSAAHAQQRSDRGLSGNLLAAPRTPCSALQGPAARHRVRHAGIILTHSSRYIVEHFWLPAQRVGRRWHTCCGRTAAQCMQMAARTRPSARLRVTIAHGNAVYSLFTPAKVPCGTSYITCGRHLAQSELDAHGWQLLVAPGSRGQESLLCRCNRSDDAAVFICHHSRNA